MLRCTYILNIIKIHRVVFETLRSQDVFTKSFLKNYTKSTIFYLEKKTKNILEILFLYILHMLNFKRLALIATEI